jgi:molecular chaperone DnaK
MTVMTTSRPPAVGIDLGTTYSVIARLDEAGRPMTIVNAEGELITPSVVLIDGADVVVGKEAVKALSSEGERIALCAKRDMGHRAYQKPLEGRLFPPEALQACILNKLARDAADQIGDFKHVVITVPAYFDEVRRKATQDAGFMAGLQVLDIINEPTAAAVAYGFQQGFLNARGEASRPQRVVVYDLGGGTFDVTVMEIAGNTFRALATDGDVELGGRDWDLRLVDLVAQQFVAQQGIDPRDDATAVGKLWRECEEAKRTLSARPKVMITCDFQGKAIRVEVTREQFQELTQDLLDRTRFTTRQAVQAAQLDWGAIDRVLLVGGSSRMPMVRDMLRQLSGMEPDVSASPDEAVAHGAALHAGLLLDKKAGQKPSFSIRNVNSHSLGVVGTDPKTGRKRNAVLVPRNTPLPVTAERVFRTQRAGQPSVLVQIVEGESPSPESCTAIGRCIIEGLPANLPAQSPIKIRFRYAANGRLAITVQVTDTGKEVTHEITRENSLSQEHLESWRQWVIGNVGQG